MKVQLGDVATEDRELIEGWLRADHVRRFWGEPEENARLLWTPSAGIHRALIQADGRKVGLIIWQHASRKELDEAGLFDVPTQVIDIDIMIGELAATGKGVGTAAIRLVSERALADETVPFVIAATETCNTASRRAFEKAGFSADREFDDPVSGRCVLLVLRRAALRA